MLPKMRYRLGLDIGSTSIGWCMMRLDADGGPVAVIRLGVRIFSDGRNPKDGSSLAVTRREARQMRRRRDRFLRRKARLTQALIRLGFFPENETDRRSLVALDPYELRRKGLDHALTGSEFARALFHMNQRRGFLSNRKTDKKDTESGVLKRAIRELRDKLHLENCRTLGEWLARRHAEHKSVRARLRGRTQKERAYDFYADRAMIEHEFEALWSKQELFNPALFTADAKAELKDILLHQRPLRPVQPGRCTILPDEVRAPLALPSVQLFRLYQEANNLRIIRSDLTESPLSLEQRNVVIGLLESRSEIKFQSLLKALKLPDGTRFNLEDVKRDRLKGNATAAVLAKEEHFGSSWYDLPGDRQDRIVSVLLEEASESKLVSWLQTETGIDEATAERLANCRLPEGYGNLSRKAIGKVLPQLVKDVVPYSVAVERAVLGSHSALSHFERTGEIGMSLPYYGEVLQRHVGFGTGNPENLPEKRYGRIANPTVHIGLNQVRKVVNELIEAYGHPSEVVVELARELKLGREAKLEIQKEQKRRQELNAQQIEEACRFLGLEPLNLDKAKRRELSQKMQLWTELNPYDVSNRRCPYTGEQISIERLLVGDVEIDHILPYSITLDDSLNNKTVALRRANRDKGNRTPHAAFGEVAQPGYSYPEILQRAALMPREKAKRFAEDGYQRWLKDDKDFLARALNDTAYLARVAKEYLSIVCPGNKVRVIPGRMTALLRGKWGLDGLLSNGRGKTRDDHRHHAVDAAVVASTDQGLLQRLATASASARERMLGRLVEDMPLPWPTFREHVDRALKVIVVSHKPDHGYQAAMHEETAWGLRGDGFVTRYKRDEATGARAREIERKAVIPVRDANAGGRHGYDGDGAPKPYKGYVGGSNYCMEICRGEKGEWVGDVVSTFQAYQVVRAEGLDAGWARLRDPNRALSGRPLVMRLMIDDTVQVTLDGRRRIMRVAVIKQNGQVSLVDHNEANVDERNRDKANVFRYVYKTAGTLQRADARRVSVSPIGDVQRGRRH